MNNKIIIKMRNLNMQNSINKIENKKDFLLSLMTKAVAHQKAELESSEWDVDYMTEEGSVQGFFSQVVLGDEDVCEQVLAEFVEMNGLEGVELTETSFIDEARNMQHELIEHLTDSFDEKYGELYEALEDSESDKFKIKIRNELIDLYYNNELIATKDTEVDVIELKVNARVRIVDAKIEELACPV